MMRIGLFVVWCVLAAFVARADEAGTRRLAEAFSAYPAMWNVRLSPDGTKTAQIQGHSDGTTLVTVIGVAQGSSTTVMSGSAGATVVDECGWVNDTRLLCSTAVPFVARAARDFLPPRGAAAVQMPMPLTNRAQQAVVPSPPPEPVPAQASIAAVNSGGSVPAELVVFERSANGSVFVDWLPDDPSAVLVMLARYEGPIMKLDAYSGATTAVTPTTGAMWFTDGRGTPRVYSRAAEGGRRWFVRNTPNADWTELERRTGIADRFLPVGLIADATELLHLDEHDGALALFALDLATGQTRLVAADPVADVRAVTAIGPTRRPAYATFGWGQTVFDAEARAAIERFRPAFLGHEIGVIDESADGRRHVFFVRAPNEAGAYYHYDADKAVASLIGFPFPALSDIELASARTVAIPAGNGSIVGGVLFEPSAPSSRRSAVVLTPRDETLAYPDLDALAEFLAAHGHVVLRLIEGRLRDCDADCARERAFGDWAYPADDIAAGAAWLVDAGFAAPDNICVVGKGTGRFLALAASLRHPDRFRCAASIGNLVRPPALGRVAGTEIIHVPSERVSLRHLARDLERPVFLAFASGERVAPELSFETLARDLAGPEKPHVAMQYERKESAMHVQVDMLTQLAEFLSAHLDN